MGVALNGSLGMQDVFTTTATAALEWGAMPYAKGVIDYQFKHYVRDDGMVWFRAEELPATARMLTVLATYYDYSGGGNDSGAFLLEHFGKAKGVADWLQGRRAMSLTFPATDPRHGIPQGTRREPFNYILMAANPISSGSPHVRPMGRTCGEPDEIKKNTHPKYFTALFREQAAPRPRTATRRTSSTTTSRPSTGLRRRRRCTGPSPTWARSGHGWARRTAARTSPRTAPRS